MRFGDNRVSPVAAGDSFCRPGIFLDAGKAWTMTSPVLDFWSPANLVDAATTGMNNAQLTAATAPAARQSRSRLRPRPKPEPARRRWVTPPPPTPQPKPEKVEPVEPVKELVKPAVKPDSKPDTKPNVTKKPERKILLVPTTRQTPNSTATPTKAAPDDSKAIKSALRALRENLSSETVIAPVGNSSAAAANYAETVKAIYERAWTPPNDTASDDANIKVRVTIASDGNVVSARVIDPSGDASVDRSVRNTLDRVQFIAPFPSGTSDKERTYIINFNLKSKRLNG